MPYLRLPNGSYVETPEGMSDRDAFAKAREKFPEAFEPVATPKSGGVAAAKAGFQELKGDIAALAGRTGLMDVEEAAKYKAAQERKAQRIFKPTEENWLEAPVTKFSELLGGSLPYMAAPAVAGGAALLGGAPALGIAGAAGLASGTQFAGSNISRQMAEGKKLEETDLGAALATAPFQAALDVTAGRLIPGIGKIFGAAGKKITPEMAEQIAKQNLTKTALDYGVKTGVVAGAEGLTEAGQQLLERLQAGLNITDAQAREEYFQSFVGGAVLGGTLALPGRYAQRRGIVAEGERLRAEEQNRLAAEQAAAEEQQKKIEAEQKAAMTQMQEIAKEQGPTEVDAARKQIRFEQIRKEIFNQERVLNQEVDALRSQAAAENNIDKLMAISARAQQVQSSLDELNPQKIGQQINKINKDTTALTKELKAATKEGNEEAVATLQQQINRNNQSADILKERLEAIKSAPGPAPSKTELADVLKQIDKARETGDLETLGKLTKKYKALQTQYEGMQMPEGAAEQASLFEETKEGVRYSEEERQQAAEQKAKQETDFQKALAEAEEKTTPKSTEVLKEATAEDIAAQRKLQTLRKERDNLEELFKKANADNDIRAAYDLRNTIIPQKEAEIAAAEQTAKEAPPTEYGLTKFNTVEEAKEIAKLKNKITLFDEQLKKAAAGTKALEKEGQLTAEGQRLADVQRQRDELLQQVQQRETKLNDINLQQGVEAQLTQQIAQAFPQRDSQVSFIGKTSALRRHVGNRLGLRANLIGLQTKLQLARRKRQDREGALTIVNQMRDLLERLNAFESESVEVPIPEKLPKNTKQYYAQLNETRQKQQRATDTYLASLQSLARRDYIGGATKKAKATKQVLEKRIDDNAQRLVDSFFDEIALHRAVTGKVALNDTQKENYNSQFAETFSDFKRLAQGELAASESAQAVLAEQITNIIQTASNETVVTAEKPLIKTQFAPKRTGTFTDVEGVEKPAYGIEKEAPPKDVSKVAKVGEYETLNEKNEVVKTPIYETTEPSALTAREKEEGKKVDVSNVGVVEQRDLFGEKQLEPIATKRATHTNFMKFVGIQGRRFRAAQAIAEKAIVAAQKPLKTLDEKIRDYRKKVAEYKKLLENVLEETKAEARQQAQVEVKAKSKQLRKEALAISEELYGAQLSSLEKSLRTMKKEQKEFVRLVSKMKDGKLKQAALKKINDTNKEIESLQKTVDSIYKNFQDAVELAPINEEERLFKEYVAADPVLKSVSATMKRKRATLEKMLAEHDQKLEQTGRERRAAQAAAEPPQQITPAEVEAEQRMLSGLNLPGVRVTGNVVVERQKLTALKEKLAGYVKKGNKKDATLTRQAIAEQQKVVDELLTPLLTPEQVAEKRETEVAALSRSSTEYSKERAEIKKRQAEMRRKEGIELAEKKRDTLNKELLQLEVDQENAKTQKEKDAIQKNIVLKRKELKAVKAIPTEERIPPSKRQVGPATRDVRPAQMKTGVAKGPSKKTIETALKATTPAKAFDFDMGVERDISGLSAQEFGSIFTNLSKGDVDFRIEETTAGTPLSQAEVQKLLDKVKMPKGLKVIVMDKLPDSIAKLLREQGFNPNKTKGWVDSSGTVVIVAGNHTSVNDAKETIAHELIGHVGVEGLLGEAGMKALIKKVSEQKGGVWKLAEDLGVVKDVEAAYLGALRVGKTKDEATEAAVKEMIAHVAETTPTKSFLQKANDFIKAMIGALRSVLRKMGLDLATNTSDVYKIIRDARKNFDSITPGAYVRKDGEITFRNNVKYNPNFADITDDVAKVVSRDKPLRDRVKGSAIGLIFRTRYIDRFAPIEAITKKMKDALEATQLMYYLRMHDQRLNWTAEIASNGPIDIVEKKRADGRIERTIESKKGANLKEIAEILRGANVGSPQAANELFTFYLAALRAKNKGIEKLNFSKDVTPELLAKVMKRIDANPTTKNAFEKAREVYNNYNDGLINFAVKTGAIAKADAALLLKERDYVPFYRPNDKGDVVLEIGGASPIKIGNLKDQPYLHDLVGGDTAIKDMFTSALQNTNLLTDMALRNLATRNVAFSLEKLALLKPISDKNKVTIRNGMGPADPKVIRFKIDGEDKHAIVEGFDNVPAELIVKGMEGVKTSLPNLVEYMAMPASTLRKFITRNPLYALRQVIRDSLSASMVSGSNAAPLLSSFKELNKMIRGKNEGEMILQRKGILGGQVLTGTSEDIKQIMLQITSGKPGWNTAMAKLDQLAIRGDAASRVSMYNSFLKQGLSEMEATLATLESMNFSKRGTSPSMFVLNMLVPFMNAQVQGLDVVYKAFAGKMPFNEKLKIKEKLIKRGAMMAGFTLAYAALMQDDEAYKNANPDEKYANWFMYVPGIDEPVRIPIPFELGLLFKALPEAIMNTAFGDEKLKDSAKAIGNMVWNSVPISLPAAIKPMIEVSLNKSFFTGREIESASMQDVEASERFTNRTSEIAKIIGKGTGVFGLSPIKLEYLIRGYTGAFPLAVVSLSNPVLRSDEAGDTPTTRASEVPVIGGLFQPKDASGLINKAYNDMEDVIKAKQTYNKKVEEGRLEEAEDYLNEKADLIGMATMAGRFRQRMGELTAQERQVRANPSLNAGEKRELLDDLRQQKIEIAKGFSSTRE